jgi:hypothetical protein
VLRAETIDEVFPARRIDNYEVSDTANLRIWFIELKMKLTAIAPWVFPRPRLCAAFRVAAIKASGMLNFKLTHAKCITSPIFRQGAFGLN